MCGGDNSSCFYIHTLPAENKTWYRMPSRR